MSFLNLPMVKQAKDVVKQVSSIKIKLKKVFNK